VASDAIARREAEGAEWLKRAKAREVALEELRAAPMPAPRVDGTCPRQSDFKTNCRSRACPVCGPRWARNHGAKMQHNLEHLGGRFATIAITGPGADRLPWDEERCKQRGRGHVHSGRRGCRVRERDLRLWCETLGLRWKWLREAAQLATKRETGSPVGIMEKVWEPQKRGVPHLHLVVPYGTPEERRVADAFRRNLDQRSAKHDFGRVQPKLKPIEGRLAARYLANYLAGRTSKKNSIRENIADPNLPKSLLWESPVLSSVSSSPRMVKWRARYGLKLGTGITMRTLRRARHLWACLEGIIEPYPRWKNLEEATIGVIVARRINPARAGPAANIGQALAFARRVDRDVARGIGWKREIWNGDPNEELFRELTRVAFLATRDSSWQREPVAA
jgi:hypothetical protein